MTSCQYIGMDVHKEMVSIAVLSATGKVVMESVIETKANTILQCIGGLRGDLHITFAVHARQPRSAEPAAMDLRSLSQSSPWSQPRRPANILHCSRSVPKEHREWLVFQKKQS